MADLAWRGREHGGIKLIVARNEFLYIATERGKVLRWQPVTKELLDLDVTKRSDDCIHGVHLDAAGRHMVVAFSHGETVYLSMAVPKPKLLTALKGTLIESVGFERDAADGSGSRPLDFLLGTSAGVIMKVTLEGGKEKNCRQVWSAGDSSAAICSIQIESVHVKSGGGDCARIFVMAASPSRYYQFIGGPTLDALFAAHARSAPQFIELPGDLPYTQLLFNRPPGGRAQSFVWLTAPGIYCGSFAFGSSNESAIVDFKLLSHPTTQDSQHRDVQDPPAPQCMGLTEFHLLLAYGSNVCSALLRFSPRYLTRTPGVRNQHADGGADRGSFSRSPHERSGKRPRNIARRRRPPHYVCVQVCRVSPRRVCAFCDVASASRHIELLSLRSDLTGVYFAVPMAFSNSLRTMKRGTFGSIFYHINSTLSLPILAVFS